jgi:branched-chain amino acid transport system permease protein
VIGYSGQFSAAQGAVFGVGAYVYAFVTEAGSPPLVALLAACGAGAVVGACLSYIGNRLQGDYFMFVTLAFQVVLVDIAQNLVNVTGGVEGKAGLKPMSLGGFTPQTQAEWLFLLVPFAVVIGIVYAIVGASRLGLIWKAIREDEAATASLGRDPTTYRVLALASAGPGTAIAGALYASYISYISPNQFTITFSIFILSVLIVGGLANPLGPFVGIVILTAVPEALRFLPYLSADVKARVLQVMYAVFLLAFLAVRPKGLVPEGVLRGARWQQLRQRFMLSPDPGAR